MAPTNMPVDGNQPRLRSDRTSLRRRAPRLEAMVPLTGSRRLVLIAALLIFALPCYVIFAVCLPLRPLA